MPASSIIIQSYVRLFHVSILSFYMNQPANFIYTIPENTHKYNEQLKRQRRKSLCMNKVDAAKGDIIQSYGLEE